MKHATLTKKQLQTRKKNQKYYAKNHESILAKQRSRVMCPNCNKTLCYSSMSKHRRMNCKKIRHDADLTKVEFSLKC